MIVTILIIIRGFPCGSDGKESACSVGLNPGSNLGWKDIIPSRSVSHWSERNNIPSIMIRGPAYVYISLMKHKISSKILWKDLKQIIGGLSRWKAEKPYRIRKNLRGDVPYNWQTCTVSWNRWKIEVKELQLQRMSPTPKRQFLLKFSIFDYPIIQMKVLIQWHQFLYCCCLFILSFSSAFQQCCLFISMKLT